MRYCFPQQHDKYEARAPISRKTACSYDACNHHFCHFLAGDGKSCFPCRKLLPDSKYPRTWLHVQDESSLQHCIQRFWWTASMKYLILWTEVLNYIIVIVFVIFHFLTKNKTHFFSFIGYDVRRIVDNWRCNHLRHFTETGKYPSPPPPSFLSHLPQRKISNPWPLTLQWIMGENFSENKTCVTATEQQN